MLDFILGLPRKHRKQLICQDAGKRTREMSGSEDSSAGCVGNSWASVSLDSMQYASDIGQKGRGKAVGVCGMIN